MKAPAAIAAIALALSSCSSITGGNNALATLAANDIPKACAIIKVAEGYFDAVKTFVPPKQVMIEAAAEAIINPICAQPPADITAAFGTLMSAWTTVQAATHVPGTP